MDRTMRKENDDENFIKKLWSGRAAQIFAVTATVFLCFLTAFEYTALRLEWDIPILQVISGDELNDRWNDIAAENMNNAVKDGNDEETPDVKNDNSENSVENVQKAEKDSAAKENADMETTETTETAEEEFPYYIKVNCQQNCTTIYTKDEKGEYTVPHKAMICSTGLYNATPRGTFQLSSKYLWRELFGGVYGQYATRITGGILFHSVPYYKRSKSALCTEKYNKLGQQASMGCIRLTVEDAKWIAENCPAGTMVEIYDDEENPGPLGKPETMKIDMDSPNKGWDPTDPDEANPWHELSEAN